MIILHVNVFPSYDKLSLKWTFLEGSVTAGYSFLRTKLIRPSVYAGLGLRYRMAMNLADYPEDELGQREMRTKILYENLDTFRSITFYYLFGGGIRYHQFSLNVFLGLTSIRIDGKPALSLGDIDINEKNRGDNVAIPSTSPDRDTANYDSAKVWGFSLGIDLVSLNLTKKDVKQKVKTFRK